MNETVKSELLGKLDVSNNRERKNTTFKKFENVYYDR